MSRFLRFEKQGDGGGPVWDGARPAAGGDPAGRALRAVGRLLLDVLLVAALCYGPAALLWILLRGGG